MAASSHQKTLSRREQNKQDKIRRIKHAARELFLRKGYDDASMREIALRAKVGLGTLFSYVTDKRDLLFLIYNDEQEALTAVAFDQQKKAGKFISDLIVSLNVYFRFFAKQPEFMCFVLRELTFYTSGRQAERFQKGRETIIAGIEKHVRDAKRRGEIASREQDGVIAQLLFSVYVAEVRRLLSRRHPNAAAGRKRLRRMLGIVVDGMRVARAARK